MNLSSGKRRTALPAAIRTRDLGKDFGERPVLRDVNLEIGAAAIVLLVGDNGAGKTTLLRCLAGDLRPTTGEIWCAGVRVTAERPWLRGRIGVVAHQCRLYPRLTLRENLLFAARTFAVSEPRRRADAMLATCGLTEHGDRFPPQVSRGMRQRAALARAMIHDPPILLLDEPFTGLDANSRGWLREHLQRLRARDRTICLASHEVAELRGLADRSLELRAGRVIDENVIDENVIDENVIDEIVIGGRPCDRRGVAARDAA